ncbi:chorismate mutase [Sneathiella chungangensis]|uniref:chorismate mutase n=1 Tax=Sneathiella chungangensis TaxID=1418234 RepID=A0A845MLC9_9PROT|nr:chorismate mutase [Sneathiella chungangensis]MZR24242.1 chorismate mutase [Sneathiella chungangensis]
MVTITNSKLDALRAEIDRLDAELLSVLEKRVAIVGDIAAAKKDDGNPLAFRPGREATILRKILSAHSSKLPDTVVAAIWRELISAVGWMQRPYSVSITAPDKSVGYWDLARFHFGSATPMKLHQLPTVVLREVYENPATLGVLPWLTRERDTWWTHLAQGGENVPRILAALPFLDNPSGEFEDLNSLVIGRAEPEPSGDDVTLMVLATREEVSRARLNENLIKAGLKGYCADSRLPDGGEGDWLHLIEMPEFVAKTDPRLVDLGKISGDGFIKAVILGAYAVPIK